MGTPSSSSGLLVDTVDNSTSRGLHEERRVVGRKDDAKRKLDLTIAKVAELEQRLAIIRGKRETLVFAMVSKVHTSSVVESICSTCKALTNEEAELEEELRPLREELRKGEKKVKDASYLSALERLGPPSVFATNSKMVKSALDRMLFLSQRPWGLFGFPATLLVAAFGELSENINSIGGSVLPSNEDCEFVYRLCSKASEIHCVEKDYRNDVVELLVPYLGSAYELEKSRESISEADVTILSAKSSRPLAIMEVTAEPGSGGDSLFQSLLYYSRLVPNDGEEFCHRPMLILELVGPYFRIGCAYMGPRVSWEPVTPFLHLFHMLDTKHLKQLARTFRALKLCLIDMDASYQNLSNEIPTSVNFGSQNPLPYPLLKKYSRNEITSLKNEVERYGTTLHYLVDKNGEKTRLVKFCKTYGSLVHKAWAAEKLAPEIFCSRNLPGDWVMVEMEWLAESEGWVSLWTLYDDQKERKTWASVQEKVFSNLKRAHALQVSFPGLDEARSVHGDVRLCNIMYNQRSGLISFIDFDWAGPHGIEKYPPFMNNAFEWPQGVESGCPMKQEHDSQLVFMEFKRASNSVGPRWSPRNLSTLSPST